MKKHLLSVSLGIVFFLLIFSLILESHILRRTDHLMKINNPNKSVFSGFSSSFYFIKNELQPKDSNTLVVSKNCVAIRLILNSDYREKLSSNQVGFIDDKPIVPPSGLYPYNQSQNECVIIDNLIGYEFNTLHQYLVLAVVVAFLAFFTSILWKTKKSINVEKK